VPTKPLVISPDFSAVEVAAIESAAERWFSALPESRAEITVSDAAPNVVRMPGEPTVVDGNARVAEAAEQVGLRLWADYADQEDLHAIVLHELGHYLGTEEHGGSIMLPMLLEVGDCITASDIALVCAGRKGGCREDSFPECE
jgi:hypothetical protein